MCGVCGCSETESSTIRPKKGKVIDIQHNLLAKNNEIAEKNKNWFSRENYTLLNIMSSPGSGKTSLLEWTLRQDLPEHAKYVIEGDQQTDFDADRIIKAGGNAIQVNTGEACHLEAEVIHQAIHSLNPKKGSLIIVENVGNLICPALFDLGESKKIVLASVTEGEDKPLKYPYIFEKADLVILTKVDLLPHLRFDPELFKSSLKRVNNRAELIPLSVFSGVGTDSWLSYLRNLI